MDHHNQVHEPKGWNSPYVAQNYAQDYPPVGQVGDTGYPPSKNITLCARCCPVTDPRIAAYQAAPDQTNSFIAYGVPQNGAPHVVPQEPVNAKPVDAAKRGHTFWSWIWELASLLLCIGLVAAIFVILATYNGQRVPDWGLSINLSTLVALLATILRATLVMIVAQVISQAKWSWFWSNGQVRPLVQLQDFDAASRGALGAAYLIPKVLLRNPVALIASVVTIVSFATGPFVQQAIKTVTCDEIVPGEQASVPIAHYAPGSSTFFTLGPGRTELTNDMKGALIAGLSNPSTVETNIVASCKTGNCTFADYASIGMCGYCKDITSLVTGPHNQTGTRFGEFRLPTGPAINFEPGPSSSMLTVNTTTNTSWVPDFPTEYSWAFLNFTVLTGKDKPSGKRCKDTQTGQQPNCDYTASACALYPCMRTYSANVSAGTFTEVPISSIPVVPDLAFRNGSAGEFPFRSPSLGTNSGGELVAIENPCRLNGATYTTSNISTAPNAIPVVYYAPPNSTSPLFTRVETAAPIECQHRFYELYARSLSRFLDIQLLSGKCSYDFSHQAGNILCNNAFWLDAFFHNWTANPEKIADTVETLALAGTNKLRVTGKTASVENDANAENGKLGDKTVGEVWTASVCTEVDWRWLLLPAILVGLTVMVLVLAIVGSWRGPVWKGSILPMVFYGGRFVTRDGEAVRGSGRDGVMTAEEMEKIAGKVNVRLAVEEDASGENGSGTGGQRRENAEVDSLLLRDAEQSPGRSA
jgi:hypothetical protein